MLYFSHLDFRTPEEYKGTRFYLIKHSSCSRGIVQNSIRKNYSFIFTSVQWLSKVRRQAYPAQFHKGNEYNIWKCT